MSGGVDSSVAAALLVEQGYRVTGVMLRLWSEVGCEDENRCCTPDALAQARRVAAQLDIPFYVFDAKEVFYREVVQSFLDGYSQGQTPNPCVVCNRRVRWGFLWDRVKALGADYLATGHYARLERDEAGQVRLLRGLDERKDQSYVLSALSQEQLAHTLFPLGAMLKPEVRALAHRLGIAVADRPDSQDLCFLGAGDYRSFVARHRPEILKPGAIVDVNGRVVGEHQGLAFYTIGQRKGLKIAAPSPLYVLAKDLHRNVLVVGEAEALGQDHLMAVDASWISGIVPQSPFRAQVKIRYKANEVDGCVWADTPAAFRVQFEHPLRDITPGQRVVLYQQQVCLGGGTIAA